VVIPMVIQTIQLALSEPNWTDDTLHATRLDPTGADQSDGEQPLTDLAVGGSSPSRRAPDQQVCRSSDEASRWCRAVRSGRNSRSNPEEQLPQHDATG
jgi:hypothetical protein